MNPWDMDPEELERQKATGTQTTPPSPVAPASVQNAPQAPKGAVSAADFDGFDREDFASPVAPTPTPLFKDEHKQAAAEMARKSAVVASAKAQEAKSAALDWINKKKEQHQTAKVQKEVERHHREVDQAIHDKRVHEAQHQDPLNPIVLERSERSETPRIRKELFQGPNTKVYGLIVLGFLCVGGWFAYKHFNPAKDLDTVLATPSVVAPSKEMTEKEKDAAEFAKQRAQARKEFEQKQLLEKSRQAQAASLAEETRLAEEARLAELQRVEKARIEEEARLAALPQVPVSQVAPDPIPVKSTPRPVSKPAPRKTAKPASSESDADREARQLREQMEKLEQWGQ